jgi:hypothetical protein
VLGGRYRVLERVGLGGMAEVFRAHDELLDRDVAVKVFRTLLNDPDGNTNGPARRELELQALARLNHPNLITLYDGSVAGDGPAYLVLEFVDGPDLATKLSEGALPEPQVHEIGAQIADALAYVHAHGLVHRDVKPANILLGGEDGHSLSGRARLSDFGIVRMIGSPQLTSAELTIGTAYYIAPEQARGSSVGPEADVYALGLVLLEALTGRRAFDGPMHEALAARLTASPTVPAGLPAPWPDLLTVMTAQDPADRPDAAQVAQRLLPAGGAVGGALGTGAAVAAAATAATAAVPALGAAPGTVAAMAAPAAAEATSGPVRVRHRRRGAGLVLAGVLLAAAFALGAFLLHADPTGSPAGPDPSAPVTHSPGTSSSSHHRAGSSTADVNTAPAAQHSTRTPSKDRTSSRSTRPAGPGAGPTTTTTAPPITSAPPSTTSAPSSTSSAPSTSPATSTSSAAAAGAGSSTSTGP